MLALYRIPAATVERACAVLGFKAYPVSTRMCVHLIARTTDFASMGHAYVLPDILVEAARSNWQYLSMHTLELVIIMMRITAQTVAGDAASAVCWAPASVSPVSLASIARH